MIEKNKPSIFSVLHTCHVTVVSAYVKYSVCDIVTDPLRTSVLNTNPSNLKGFIDAKSTYITHPTRVPMVRPGKAFRFILKTFCSEVDHEYKRIFEDKVSDLTPWLWYGGTDGEGPIRLWLQSIANLARIDSKVHTMFTRDNYEFLDDLVYELTTRKLCTRVIKSPETKVSHEKSTISSWEYILPEFHCFVLEVERASHSGPPRTVNAAPLDSLLLELKQFPKLKDSAS